MLVSLTVQLYHLNHASYRMTEAVQNQKACMQMMYDIITLNCKNYQHI
jgi:hypothetical protein